METTNNPNQTPDVPSIVGTSATKDPTMDLSSLLKTSKSSDAIMGTENPGKSPLALAMEEKEKGGNGLVIDNDELDKDQQVKEQHQLHEADFQNKLNELDQSAEILKGLELRQPSTAIEFAHQMDIVTDIAESGAISESNIAGAQNFIQTKEKTDAPVRDITEEMQKQAGDDDKGVRGTEKYDIDRAAIIELLIDKTGMGANIEFTAEEKEKIINAKKIKITEVENLDISTVRVAKAKKPFLENINAYQLSTSMTPVTFPASRFKAKMKGLSFGELGDISLNPENTSFEMYNKRMSVIYNAITNANIGAFDGYNDFLNKMAYPDIDLAVYGILCSTFPEQDTITLRCQREGCGKEFEHVYSPRALLQFDQLSDRVLTALKDTAGTTTISDSLELFNNGPCQNNKVITLPRSKYLAYIGVASAYEYLNRIINNLVGDTFKENHPDDINGMLNQNVAFLTVVRSIAVPNDEGEYDEYDETEDLLQILYHLPPEDTRVLMEYVDFITKEYQTLFAIKDVECPHCKHATKSIPVDINDLVFMKYQTLASTEIELRDTRGL